MPDATIVRVMASFRSAVQSGEDAAVQRMAQGWLAVERRLQDSAELTARIILDEQRAGRPVTRIMLLRNDRFLTLLDQARAEVNRYIPEAEQIIRGQQQALASLGIEHASTAIQTVAANAQFNRLPTAAVQNMIGLAGDGSPLRTLLQNSYGAGADGILDQMVKGVALGRGPVAIARAIVRQGLSRSLDRMIVVNRTEGLRVYRQASLDSYRASGIVSGYLRIAAKSARTCVGCLMADHRFYPLTVPFEEHVQGRCTAVPAVDGAPMPTWKTGADWFVEQPAATQREMLGPGRYDAWKANKFDLGALVTVRQDATWGNSVVPTPLRGLVG